MSVVEHMMCDDADRFAFQRGTAEFNMAVAQLVNQFGDIDASGWFSVSTPQYNSIYDDDIVSAVIQVRPAYLEHLTPAAVGRKFFLRKGWVYDKVYSFTTSDQCSLPRPTGALPMFIGELVNVYGQPGDDDLTRYKCLYFMHQDHAAVEAWGGQSLPQGAYSTFYAATFDTLDGNRMLRLKTYCYSDQGGFSDWDVTYLQECKKRGVLDAIK